MVPMDASRGWMWVNLGSRRGLKCVAVDLMMEEGHGESVACAPGHCRGWLPPNQVRDHEGREKKKNMGKWPEERGQMVST